MGLLGKLLLLSAALSVVYVGIKVNKLLFEIPPLPKLENTWWGPGESGEDDTAIRPFKVNVPDEVNPQRNTFCRYIVLFITRIYHNI